MAIGFAPQNNFAKGLASIRFSKQQVLLQVEQGLLRMPLV